MLEVVSLINFSNFPHDKAPLVPLQQGYSFALHKHLIFQKDTFPEMMEM